MERSVAMKVLLSRQNAFKLFRALNSSLLNKYLSLKSNYNFNTPPTAEIINALKTWKAPFERTVSSQIQKVLQVDTLPQCIDPTEVVAKIIQNYKQQQQFIEIFKNLTSSIETIKDFIRTQYFRDTSSDAEP